MRWRYKSAQLRENTPKQVRGEKKKSHHNSNQSQLCPIKHTRNVFISYFYSSDFTAVWKSGCAETELLERKPKWPHKKGRPTYATTRGWDKPKHTAGEITPKIYIYIFKHTLPSLFSQLNICAAECCCWDRAEARLFAEHICPQRTRRKTFGEKLLYGITTSSGKWVVWSYSPLHSRFGLPDWFDLLYPARETPFRSGGAPHAQCCSGKQLWRLCRWRRGSRRLNAHCDEAVSVNASLFCTAKT